MDMSGKRVCPAARLDSIQPDLVKSNLLCAESDFRVLAKRYTEFQQRARALDGTHNDYQSEIMEVDDQFTAAADFFGELTCLNIECC